MTFQSALHKSLPFTHTFTQCIYSMCSTFSVRRDDFAVQYLAQGHFSMKKEEDWDRTTELLVRGRPLYPLNHRCPYRLSISISSLVYGLRLWICFFENVFWLFRFWICSIQFKFETFYIVYLSMFLLLVFVWFPSSVLLLAVCVFILCSKSISFLLRMLVVVGSCSVKSGHSMGFP